MITFNFNGIDFSTKVKLNDGISGRGLMTSAVNSINIPRRAGSVYGGKKYEERTITVPFTIAGTDGNDLRDKLEELAMLLHTDKPAPLIFSDEPDRTYFAVALGANDDTDVTYRHSQGTITFLCNDPIKYGDEVTSTFTDGATVINNGGSLPTRPIITATALEDITYVDVFTDKAYMRVGQPPDLGVPPQDPLTLRTNAPMNNLTGWTYGGTAVDGGPTQGTFAVSGGSSFVANSTGAVVSGSWHGPAVKQFVPAAPHPNFVIEFAVKMPTIKGSHGRAEVYMLDDLGNAIGKLAIVSNPHRPNNKVEIRLGGGSVYTFPVNYFGGKIGNEWNNFDGIIRLTKTGNVFDMYVAKVDPNTGRHFLAHSTRYTDHNNLYGGSISQVQLHIGKYSNNPLLPIELKDLKVWQINEIPSTDPRIIARAGDVIDIDSRTSSIRINGESRQDLKDFGGTFFTVPRGAQAILIEPRASLTAQAVIREEYL